MKKSITAIVVGAGLVFSAAFIDGAASLALFIVGGLMIIAGFESED